MEAISQYNGRVLDSKILKIEMQTSATKTPLRQLQRLVNNYSTIVEECSGSSTLTVFSKHKIWTLETRKECKS